MSMYHDGNRELQDAFGSRALADRLEEKLKRDRFTEDDAAFIPNLQLMQASPYLPKAAEPPIEPKWKSFEIFAGVVPPRRR